MEGQRKEKGRAARNSLIKITRPTDEAWAGETGWKADCANGWSEVSGHAKKRREGFDSKMREKADTNFVSCQQRAHAQATLPRCMAIGE